MITPRHLLTNSATFSNGTKDVQDGGNVAWDYSSTTTVACRIQADQSEEALAWVGNTGKLRYTVLFAAADFTPTKDCQINWGGKLLRVLGPPMNPGAADVLTYVRAEEWQGG